MLPHVRSAEAALAGSRMSGPRGLRRRRRPPFASDDARTSFAGHLAGGLVESAQRLAGAAKLGMPLESLSQRAKHVSPGGTMVIHAPKNSAQCAVSPMWSLSTVRERGVGPLMGGQIVFEE